MESTALDYLNRDSLLHMGMIVPIQRNTADILFAGTEGALLWEKQSGAYMLTAESLDIGSRLLEKVPEGALWVAHQQFMVDPIQKKYQLKNCYPCYQAVYQSSEKKAMEGPLTLTLLDSSYAARIAERYQLVNLEEIQNVIANKELYGGFVDSEWVGFGGFHSEGSIGMLEIFPHYRRRGLAYQFESFLINTLLEQGRTPFAQIFPDNIQSIRLHQKLGFTLTSNLLYWMD